MLARLQDKLLVCVRGGRVLLLTSTDFICIVEINLCDTRIVQKGHFGHDFLEGDFLVKKVFLAESWRLENLLPIIEGEPDGGESLIILSHLNAFQQALLQKLLRGINSVAVRHDEEEVRLFFVRPQPRRRLRLIGPVAFGDLYLIMLLVLLLPIKTIESVLGVITLLNLGNTLELLELQDHERLHRLQLEQRCRVNCY